MGCFYEDVPIFAIVSSQVLWGYFPGVPKRPECYNFGHYPRISTTRTSQANETIWKLSKYLYMYEQCN